MFNLVIWVRTKSDYCAWPEVTLVTWPVRKYVLRMHNRKLRNIRHSGACLTGSDKVIWPEMVLTGSMFCACPAFPPRFFLSSSTVVTWVPDVIEGHFTPSVFPWVCAWATGWSPNRRYLCIYPGLWLAL
jgi:hypothetical protein